MSRALHPLAESFCPYVCAAPECRSRATVACDLCKSFRFCGRAHAQAQWADHDNVCKALRQLAGSLELRGQTCRGKPQAEMNQLLPQAFREAQRALGAGPRLPTLRELRALMRSARCEHCGRLPLEQKRDPNPTGTGGLLPCKGCYLVPRSRA